HPPLDADGTPHRRPLDADGAPDGRPLDGAALALTFLTVIPIRPRRGVAADLGRAAVWFPAVGALVGLLAGAVRTCSAALFGPAVASVLALVVLVAVTGALHQDGLADCADGLGVRGDRKRRLAVMRDSAIGAFGTLALLGWALLLVGALATLSDHAALRALVTAAIVGRWAALVHATATATARADGLGASFTVARAPLIVASAATIVAAVLIDGPVDGLASVAAGAAVAGIASAWARRALGGRTGDTLGATVALAEVAVCLTLLAFATT
ncbi:MAG TPA: adenosylcobinamide-GDP ribazoletransferase, partial [Solirubrobacteraceae bacterium]|nr:adenosylcobinamide-GDP ribazoletransferase [Solirubrobacteraceae bacterium]